MQRQLDHGAVHQLDCGQAATEFDDVLRGIHGRVKGREIHHAQHLGAGQFAELQSQVFGQRQRAFAAHQQVRQIDRAVGGVGTLVLVVKDVEVVAADPSQDLGPAGVDVGRELLGQGAHVVAQFPRLAAAAGVVTQRQQRAVGSPRLCATHVVHHVAVGNAAAAAGVVAGHAAQRGLCAGGDIDRVPQAVFFQAGVEVV